MPHPGKDVLLEQRISHLLDERGTLEGCYRKPWQFAYLEALVVFALTFFASLAIA